MAAVQTDAPALKSGCDSSYGGVDHEKVGGEAGVLLLSKILCKSGNQLHFGRIMLNG
jgi:hypothetical protein